MKWRRSRKNIIRVSWNANLTTEMAESLCKPKKWSIYKDINLKHTYKQLGTLLGENMMPPKFSFSRHYTLAYIYHIVTQDKFLQPGDISRLLCSLWKSGLRTYQSRKRISFFRRACFLLLPKLKVSMVSAAATLQSYFQHRSIIYDFVSSKCGIMAHLDLYKYLHILLYPVTVYYLLLLI